MEVIQLHTGTPEKKIMSAAADLSWLPSPSLQSWDHGVTPQPAMLPFPCASPSNPCTPGSGTQHPNFCSASPVLWQPLYFLPGEKKERVSVLHETTRKPPWDSLVLLSKETCDTVITFCKLEANTHHYSQEKKKVFLNSFGRF